MSLQYNLYLIDHSSFHLFFSFKVNWSSDFKGTPKDSIFYPTSLYPTLEHLLSHIDHDNEPLQVLCIPHDLHSSLPSLEYELKTLSSANRKQINSSKYHLKTFYNKFISTFQIEPIQYFLFLLQIEERKQLMSKKRKVNSDNNDIRKKFKLFSITNGE